MREEADENSGYAPPSSPSHIDPNGDQQSRSIVKNIGIFKTLETRLISEGSGAMSGGRIVRIPTSKYLSKIVREYTTNRIVEPVKTIHLHHVLSLSEIRNNNQRRLAL